MNLTHLYDSDLELDVVGAAIMQPGAFAPAWDVGLRAEHIGNSAMATIWRVAERLFLGGIPVDATSIMSEMSPAELQDVGRDRLIKWATDKIYSHRDSGRKAKRIIELAKVRSTFFRVLQMAEERDFKASAKYLASELQALSLELVASEQASELVTGDEAGRRARARAAEFAASGDGFPGTGWPVLDRILGGFRPGQTYCIAGHEKSGKTMVAMEILQHNSIAGRKGLYIGLETEAIEMAERMHGWEDDDIAARTAQGQYDDRTSKLMQRAGPQHDAKAKNIVYATDLAGDRRSIEAALVRAIQQHGIQIAVLDYITLVQRRKWSKDNSTMELYDLSRWLRVLAKRLRVPILILSQYNNRAFDREKKAPIVADIFGGGALRKDCASLVMMETPWITDREKSKTEAFFHVATNRFGPTAIVEMYRSRVGTYSEIGVVEGSYAS